MMKSKKQLKEQQQQVKEQHAQLEERLTTTNDAYTRGAFHYLRLLIHTIGLLQFVYGIYYHWTYVHWAKREQKDDQEHVDEVNAHWGGKFKFLTFLDMILQSIYHFIALLNDLFGSNAVGEQCTMPRIRKLRDYIFAAWAFPIAHSVAIPFWLVYAYDRELILPKALDAIYPNWLNHIAHTNVAMLAILDMFTCFRQYPTRRAGLSGSITFMLLYLIWIHIVRYFSGNWVYPILNVLNVTMRYLMLSALLANTVLCYFLGAILNKIIWQPELSLLQRMKQPKREEKDKKTA